MNEYTLVFGKPRPILLTYPQPRGKKGGGVEKREEIERKKILAMGLV